MKQQGLNWKRHTGATHTTWLFLAAVLLMCTAVTGCTLSPTRAEPTAALPTRADVATIPVMPTVQPSPGGGEAGIPIAAATPTLAVASPTPGVDCTYAMQFVADVTIPDDTVLPAGTGFVKTWRIRNNGNCPWPAGTAWFFAGGYQMTGPDWIGVPVTAPGGTVDVSVNLMSPAEPGTYTGYWGLRLPGDQELEQRYFVRIVVPAPTATPAPATATPQPTQPTTVITNWRGEYFNNGSLVGQPVLVRDDAAVQFNWGEGAPAATLPADNFSVFWTRSLYFEGGTYRFYAYSDDGVRVWVDNVLLINEWHDATNVTHQRELALSAGMHSLRVEYYENRGLARIQFWWEHVDYYPNWRGEYWSNRHLSGQPTLVRDDSSVNFNWQRGAPAANLPGDNFSARWTRTMSLAEGTYRFHVVVDDGMRLTVDDNRVIDQWRDGSRRELEADVWLEEGTHTLRVEYYEHTDQAVIQLWWERISGYPEWKGEYWSNRELSGRPVLVRNDRRIDFNWGLGAPAPTLPVDKFSARWTRELVFDDGLYRFYARVDDGIRLYVDGERIIDQWRDSSADRNYQADLILDDGSHTVKVEYYENHVNARVRVWFERIGARPTATSVPTNTPPPTAVPATATASPTPLPLATATSLPTNTPTATNTPTTTKTPATE